MSVTAPEPIFCRVCGRGLRLAFAFEGYDPQTGSKRWREFKRCPSFWCRNFRGGHDEDREHGIQGSMDSYL